MLATVSAEGQVTIPKSVRDSLGLGPGSQVDFRQTPDGLVVLVRAEEGETENRFAKWVGHAGPGLSTDEIMAMTRGED